MNVDLDEEDVEIQSLKKDKVSISFGMEADTNIEDKKRSIKSNDERSLYSFKIS